MNRNNSFQPNELSNSLESMNSWDNKGSTESFQPISIPIPILEETDSQENFQEETIEQKQHREDARFPVCYSCRERIKEKRCVILGKKKYHLNHFKCEICKRDLTSLQFFEINNKVYCENDYKKSIGSFCAVCRQLIVGKYGSGRNASYHLDCFICQLCSQGIYQGQQFFFGKNGKQNEIYCEKCKHKVAAKCGKCSKIIMENEQTFNNKPNVYFHRQCLKCAACGVQKENVDFIMRSNNAIIHATCIPTCGQCMLPIQDTQEAANYFDTMLHAACLKGFQEDLRQNTLNAFSQQAKNNRENSKGISGSSYFLGKPKTQTAFTVRQPLISIDRKKWNTTFASDSKYNDIFDAKSGDETNSCSNNIDISKDQCQSVEEDCQGSLNESFVSEESINKVGIEEKYKMSIEQLNDQFNMDMRDYKDNKNDLGIQVVQLSQNEEKEENVGKERMDSFDQLRSNREKRQLEQENGKEQQQLEIRDKLNQKIRNKEIFIRDREYQLDGTSINNNDLLKMPNSKDRTLCLQGISTAAAAVAETSKQQQNNNYKTIP